jgi:long-chain acyl-CoA synthetase
MSSRRDAGGVIVGERFRSTADLLDRGARLATVLAGMGVAPGARVLGLLGNDFAFYEVAFAVRRLGGVLVPVSTLLTAGEIATIAADCAAAAVAAGPELADLAAAAAPGVPMIVTAGPGDAAASHAYQCRLDAAQPWTGPRQPPAEPMLYTSGTTGRPKGVRKSAPTAQQQAAMSAWLTELFDLRPGMRTLIANPLYHSAAYGYSMLVLGQGGVVVLERRFDAETFLRLIEAHRVTHLQMVPTMMHRLLKLPEDVRDRYDTGSLRHVLHGAGPCSPALKHAMIAWWGPIINEYYGATETGGVVACSAAEWLAHPGTVGRPRDGAVVRVVNDEGRDVPAGVIGTIYVWHPSMPEFTYHGDPDKRRNMELDGLFSCGDVGYLDAEGYLYIADRRTDLILCGGVNVYPAEIERELSAMPGIADCAVVGAPDEDLGQVPMAFVELEPGLAVTLDDVRAFLAGRLARQKLPRRLQVLDRLPREATGKVRKPRLLDLVNADPA